MINIEKIKYCPEISVNDFDFITISDTVATINGNPITFLNDTIKIIHLFSLENIFDKDFDHFIDSTLSGFGISKSLSLKIESVYNGLLKNINSLKRTYPFSNYYLKGNVSVLFDNEFNFKKLVFNFIIYLNNLDENKPSDILNVNILIDEHITYTLRKDLERAFIQNNISNVLFLLLLEPDIFNVIDDLSVDYTEEEVLKFKVLLDMVKV